MCMFSCMCMYVQCMHVCSWQIKMRYSIGMIENVYALFKSVYLCIYEYTSKYVCSRRLKWDKNVLKHSIQNSKIAGLKPATWQRASENGKSLVPGLIDSCFLLSICGTCHERFISLVNEHLLD